MVGSLSLAVAMMKDGEEAGWMIGGLILVTVWLMMVENVTSRATLQKAVGEADEVVSLVEIYKAGKNLSWSKEVLLAEWVY